METTGNTILMTGGGSGIGQALAHRLHDLGNTVIITGRRVDALKRSASGRANIVPMELDVDSAEEIESFAKRVVEAHPELNVLINNAGIMRTEAIGARRNIADAEATIITNLLGPIRLTNALMDHLVAQKNATIINTTSGLATVPRADAATYCATKAALHSYTISLREALKGKVEVIELVPPGVQTTLTPGQETREGYQALDEYADETMALLTANPTPTEILVERVKFLYNAERENRFADALAKVNAPR